jgi:hypothetical protein
VIFSHLRDFWFFYKADIHFIGATGVKPTSCGKINRAGKISFQNLKVVQAGFIDIWD